MLTALDIVNRIFGYFNIQDKPKGRVFTIIAFFANFYLLYVAVANLRYAGYRIRGALFLTLFLVLLYFIYLNFMYYFTNKKAPADISPVIERALGGNAKARKAAAQAFVQKETPTAGVFTESQLLPTTLVIGSHQQRNIDRLAKRMEETGVMTLDYQGVSDRVLNEVAQQTAQPVLAMGKPVLLPYFELAQHGKRWIIRGGLNELDATELAEVVTVGLSPIAEAQSQFNLALASVTLSGGPQKEPGRSGLRDAFAKFTIEAKVAYVNTNK
ncbi:DUF6681 family protein [Lacticaseibacillus thailandensis]|uniref:Uncharacterized protein n=1 Tax=Lacticaseibacillus thailandensis DSM 22698 = JCM 13996 TaxID=1423810 RepID=A0A0R2C7F7_9LACO|nr:DUF6681 family protein [Lacticaseibacillus thailandensis]KRM87576.1 hypothetical protein FD19_GL001088 [Lacticaseibacillus thailandensis DSM 22698 = JCM 13996]